MNDNYDEPGWSPNELSEAAADLWSSARGIETEPSERDAFAFAVHLFVTDPEMGEALDRMRFTGEAAA